MKKVLEIKDMDKKAKRIKRKKTSWLKKINKYIKESPINFFSDLFIVAMVSLWIADSVYESLIASMVTISSIVLSFQTGVASYDTSMWGSIGTNIAVPLGAGGVMFLIKCTAQHAIANYKGEQAQQDFPNEEVSMDDLGELGEDINISE